MLQRLKIFLIKKINHSYNDCHSHGCIKMKIPLYQIDAFAKKTFLGNPAAICPLSEWLNGDVMQAIAAENNLSETAFFIETDNDFHIRWFTPSTEVDLCGHATLAAAHVIFNELNYNKNSISFDSKSGILKVRKDKSLLIMDFPVQTPIVCDTPKELELAFGIKPIACLKSEDYIFVVENESDVINAKPDLNLLKKIDLRGTIITSRSGDYDFISRCFAPKYGIDEDPVTGSAHTELVPYWAEQLNKTKLTAKQVSQRGGELFCQLEDERVSIAGYAVKYLQGEITI